MSARELASLLDHSDIQNVRVYTDISRIISDRLEKAAAGKIEFVIDLLTGQIKPEDIKQHLSPSTKLSQQPEGTAGKRSCASCPAFQPYAYVVARGAMEETALGTAKGIEQG